MTERDPREPWKAGRRTWDHVYYWIPIILSLVISAISAAMTLGILLGHIDGKFELINFRLETIEQKTGIRHGAQP